MQVNIKGQFITIGQLLKKLQYVSTGGQVKNFLKNNQIKINAKVPIGRSTKVFVNSTVWINDDLYKIIETS